jgi:hypothetical protein
MSSFIPGTPACPRCRQIDQVRPVPQVVSWSNSLRQLPQAQGSPQALLGRRLAPPPEPVASGTLAMPEVLTTGVMGVIAILAVAMALVAIRQMASLGAEAATDPLAAPFATSWRIVFSASLLVFILCLLSFAVTVRRYYRRQNAQRESQLARQDEWEKALTTWEQLCYCFRCDGVFLPGSDSQLVAVEYMPALVYR